jgi:hypothetical protein
MTMGYLLLFVGACFIAYSGYRIVAHRHHLQPVGSDTTSDRPDTMLKDLLFAIFGLVVMALGFTFFGNFA